MRLRGQDNDAWERLCDLYMPLIFSWCRRAGIQGDDSADIVQEVFRAVFRGIAEFRYRRSGDTFRGWLRTVTRNKICDYFRHESRQPTAVGGTEAHIRFMEVAEIEPSDSPDAGPVVTLIHRVLALIRPEFENTTWQAFWLVAVEDRSAAEAAEQLEMTVGAVRQAKYRVLRRLREELGDVE